MPKKIIITESQFKQFIKRQILSENGYGQDEIGEIACCINDDGDYDVELFDAETYHKCGYEIMTIDEIEENFGRQIASEVETECADGKEHRYELAMYDNETIDLTDKQALSTAAMQRLRYGEYTRNCRGFILPNGVIVYTDAEHNMCTRIPGIKNTFHFIQLGCIRVLDHSIDLACQPTPKQWAVLEEIFDSYYGQRLDVDLMNKQIGNASKTYYNLEPDEIINDIRNYFSTGKIRRSVYESTLYHGSRADFNEFNLAYALTGWGEMAYGYGVYLSDYKDAAEEYSKGGILYTVEVPKGKYIDSDYINPKEAMSIALKFKDYYLSTEYGSSAYKGHENEFWESECKYVGTTDCGLNVYGSISSILGSDREASQFLRNIGYLGIKCHVKNRDTGFKFINYVIFDPKDIKIIKKEKQ